MTTYTNPDELADRARALGVARRLRALAWMGHDPVDVGHRYGFDGHRMTSGMLHGDMDRFAPRVDSDTWRGVVIAFADLAMTFGDADDWAATARARRWKPPLAWEDEWLDDYTQRGVVMLKADPDHVDEVVVLRRMAGDHDVPMTRTERREAVRRMHARGLTDPAIADALGLWPRTVFNDRGALGLPPIEDPGRASPGVAPFRTRSRAHNGNAAA